MKEFWVFTGLRIAMFLATWAIVSAVWLAVSGAVSLGLTFIISAVASAPLSYVLLRRQREAFAVRVEQRAERASSRFEEMKAKEDVD